MKTLLELVHPDGLKLVEILQLENGFCSWQEMHWVEEIIPAYGPEAYWNPVNCSGLYESAHEAEAAARADVPWLRTGNSD